VQLICNGDCPAGQLRPLGETGPWVLLACCALAVADQLHRRGVVALPGVVLLPGAWLVHIDHIFAPAGAIGMGMIGLGTAWLAAHANRSTAQEGPVETTAGRGIEP